MGDMVFVVRASDLKSEGPEFNSRSYHQLDLFQVVPSSTPRLRLYMANWSSSSSCYKKLYFLIRLK